MAEFRMVLGLAETIASLDGDAEHFPVPVFESMGVAVSLASTKDLVRVPAENMSLTDIYDETKTLLRAFLDTLDVSDSLIRQTAFHMAFAETIASDDARASSSHKNPHESLSFTDTIVKSFTRNFLELLNVSDGDIEEILLALSENVSISDALLRGLNFFFDPVENNSLSDTAQNSVGISLEESLSIDEQIASLLVLQRSLSEQLAIDEDIVPSLTKVAHESFSLAAVVVNALTRSLSDDIPITDTASRLVAFIRALSEAVSISDGDAESFARSFSDTVEMGDAALTQSALVRSIAEIMELGDSKTLSPSLAKTDALAIAEEIVKGVWLPITEDYFPFSDSMNKQATLLKLLSEAYSMGDRLRIGGVWADPTTKVISAIIKAVFATSVIEVKTN